MNQRLAYGKVDPASREAMLGMERFVDGCGLEESLLDLVRLRASQINHCAFCLDMHMKDAIASGETLDRLYMLDAWRESGVYTERERAALEWTEAVTLVAETNVPDEIYERVRPHFTEIELVRLTMMVITINGWNRLNAAFRTPPGHYTSRRQPRVAAESVG